MPIDKVLDERLAKAVREQDEILSKEPHRSIADPTLPVSRLCAEMQLEDYEKKYIAGDKMSLLAAVRECARCSIPLPDWTATEFIKAYDKVLSYRAGSWDEVFGSPYKKGTHLGRRRQARVMLPRVWLEVKGAMERGESINSELFHDIGKRLGLGKTRVEELYAAAKLRLGRPGKT